MYPPNKNIKNNYNKIIIINVVKITFTFVNVDVSIDLVTASKVGSSKWKKWIEIKKTSHGLNCEEKKVVMKRLVEDNNIQPLPKYARLVDKLLTCE